MQCYDTRLSTYAVVLRVTVSKIRSLGRFYFKNPRKLRGNQFYNAWKPTSSVAWDKLYIKTGPASHWQREQSVQQQPQATFANTL
jgi:hypothetical protein